MLYKTLLSVILVGTAVADFGSTHLNFDADKSSSSSSIAASKSNSSDLIPNKAFVNYDDFEALVQEVKNHRAERIISWNQFLRKSREPNSVVLDTRSEKMYNAKHLKGAIHLNFSDFNQEELQQLIPDPTTQILIYCNNNFEQEEELIEYFPTKVVVLPVSNINSISPEKTITLALNIPTYINLYGYGYQNVFELGELISGYDPTVQFEGTAVN